MNKNTCQKLTVPILVLCFFLSGCFATSKIGYKKGQESYLDFKDLSDAEAMQMVVNFHNVTTEKNEDYIAKQITITEYTKELKKRNSKAIQESGIFELSYNEIDLKKWHDEKIVEMFKYLNSQVSTYIPQEVPNLSKNEKDLMIIRITAKEALYQEGMRRDTLRKFMDVFTQVLVTAINIGLSAL